jgi:hypothetical protein
LPLMLHSLSNPQKTAFSVLASGLPAMSLVVPHRIFSKSF